MFDNEFFSDNFGNKKSKNLLFLKDIHHNLIIAFNVMLALYDWYNQILVWWKQPVPYTLAEYFDILDRMHEGNFCRCLSHIIDHCIICYPKNDKHKLNKTCFIWCDMSCRGINAAWKKTTEYCRPFKFTWSVVLVSRLQKCFV